MTNEPNNILLMLIDDSMFDLKINARIAVHAKLFTDIISCSSGREALQYLSENLQNPEKLPQLILLDIQMPEMNGFEFMEHYALLPDSFKEKCLVAMLSSTDDANDIEQVNADPHIVSLLRKPLLPAVLQELMADNLS